MSHLVEQSDSDVPDMWLTGYHADALVDLSYKSDIRLY